MTQKHTAPQGGEAAALPANCANCYRATSPLPTDWTALDFFDRPVAAQDAVFRTTCTAVPDAVKPCLRPAATSAAPTLAAFTTWLTASQQRALDAMNATTGDTFGKHCDDFIALTTAINVVREFEQATAAQSSANSPESAA